MTKLVLLSAASAAALLACAGSAQAALVVTSYSMPNGDGQAHSGSYNYWDRSYNGLGLTNVDGAPLSGGTGDLTDGVIAAVTWSAVENVAGTGPYVGWRGDVGVSNPLIKFNFGSVVTVSSVSIHMDNSLFGGVGAPIAIWIDGVAQGFTAPAAGTIGTVTIAGLNLVGSAHTVQFFQNPNQPWTFVSEVTFDGRVAAVPEAATWAMMIGGFALAGAAMRRRTSTVSFA